jgi:hypothetical protein
VQVKKSPTESSAPYDDDKIVRQGESIASKEPYRISLTIRGRASDRKGVGRHRDIVIDELTIGVDVIVKPSITIRIDLHIIVFVVVVAIIVDIEENRGGASGMRGVGGGIVKLANGKHCDERKRE